MPWTNGGLDGTIRKGRRLVARFTKTKERDVVFAALSLLRECYSDYSNPNFTDRHGTANRIKKVLEEVS